MLRVNKHTYVISIYILIYISALAYLRYTATGSSIMSTIRVGCMYTVVIIGIIYLLVHRKYHKYWLYPLLGGMVCFELASSVINSLFVFPIILVDVVVWPLLFMVFFTYSRTTDFSRKFKIITLIGTISMIITAIPSIMMGYSAEAGSALFATYFCITFLPLAYIFLSDRITLILSIVVGIIMLLTLKRAALIAIVAGIFIYYIIKSNNNEDKKTINKLLKFMIATIFVILLGSWIIDKLGLNILQRMTTIFEDGGSGRTRIWDVVISQFNNSTLIRKWIGNGFHAVFYRIRPLGISRFAHNSFLETLYDYGYIGLLLLILLVMYIIINTGKLIRRKHYLAPAIGFTIVPMLLFGAASYFFEQSVIIMPFCAVWGICIGTYEREKIMYIT